MAGIQQQELARLAGMNGSHISLIEKGTRRPSTRALDRICAALAIPTHLFMLLGVESADLRNANPEEIQRAGESLARLILGSGYRSRSGGKRRTSRKAA